MSQYYTVRQTSNNETEVIVSRTEANNRARENNSKSVHIVEAVVETDENGEAASSAALVNSEHRSVQLMGMASTLPSSNLFVNYPHTMWERDSDGNRIPVTVVKAEEANAEVSQEDLLVQAANIKTEAAEVDSNTTVTTITIPANASQNSSTNQTIVNPSSSAIMPPVPSAQRIVVMKASSQDTTSNGEPAARPHVCEVCTKTFAKREHLTKHLRIHKSDNKRYSCEYCQKAFRDRYELVRHTRRHTGDFPFR